MAFVLNVGNYTASVSRRSLPDDMPVCDSLYLQADQKHYPACDCYENPNSIMGTYLTANYKCSRDHLCHHVNSRAANLDRYHYIGGDEIHNQYKTPGWSISFISVAVVFVLLALMRQITLNWVTLRSACPQVLRNRKDEGIMPDQKATTLEVLSMTQVDESVNKNQPLSELYDDVKNDRQTLTTKSSSFRSSERSLSDKSLPQVDESLNQNQPLPELVTDVQNSRETFATTKSNSCQLERSLSEEPHSNLSNNVKNDRPTLAAAKSNSFRELKSLAAAKSSSSFRRLERSLSLKSLDSQESLSFRRLERSLSQRSWGGDISSALESHHSPSGSRTLEIQPPLTLEVRKSDNNIPENSNIDKEEIKRDRSSSNVSELSEPPLPSTPDAECPVARPPRRVSFEMDQVGSISVQMNEWKALESHHSPSDKEEIKRDHSSSNISELSEPPLPSTPDAEFPVARPSRRVSFEMDQVGSISDQMNEWKEENITAVETAAPILHRVSFNSDKSPANVGCGVREQEVPDVSSSFWEQLRRVVSIQYKIYRPLCKFPKF